MGVKLQYLVLPCYPKTYLESGAYNKGYKDYWKYEHLGWDMTGNTRDEKAIIFASGIGQVVTAGYDYKYGNVLAIQYFNVYNKKTNQTKDVVARYMHMASLSVKVGDKVTTDTPLGVMGNTGSGKWGLHLHIEFDYNIANPNLSAQVAGSNIFKKNTDITTIINPNQIFYVNKNKGQQLSYYTNTWYVSDDLKLLYAPQTVYDNNINNKVGGDIISNYQELILPNNNMRVTCSYKNKAYETTFKIGTHYGTDFSGSLQIWGSGNGEVIKTGYDSCFGNFVVVKYPNVLNHKTKKILDVVFRYFHFNSVSVKTGDKITKDTKLGIMGSTGTYSSGIHCHLEADTDTRLWNYTPTLRGSTTFFQAGSRTNDTTFNVMEVLHIKTSAPDNQVLTRNMDEYVSVSDVDIPKII